MKTVEATLAAIWARQRDGVRDQLSVIERATAALVRGSLDEELRASAAYEAHRLAGSLGTFGFAAGSDRARHAERLLGVPDRVSPDHAPLLSELVCALRDELETDRPEEPANASLELPVFGARAPSLLVVEDDAALAETLVAEAERRGVRAEIAATPAEARARSSATKHDVVLLDLLFGSQTTDAFSLLAELTTRSPPIPVLVFTSRDTFVDRVEAVRRGASGFVHKSLPAQEAVEQVIQLVERSRTAAPTVLAVDDDPILLEATRAILEPQGIGVATLDDPLRFWDELERVRPQIVLLDVELPEVSGIEMCRVLRNDPRWASTPVLFLTSRRDTATIQEIFDAGADDYVSKPVVGEELVARIRGRLDRFQLHRVLAEQDTLTGVANRRSSTQALDRLIRLSTRFEQPLAVVALDLDNFKSINDRYGHSAGDAVLRCLGELLRRAFRGEDVIGRWGGEEFVLGMYGMAREDALQRMHDVLNAFRGERFHDVDGKSFQASFSAGVAEMPADGEDLTSLYQAADEALYRAKAEGRARVLPSAPAAR